MKNNKKQDWIDNGQPSDFPTPNDGWIKEKNEWIDNGQPSDFPKPNDGWFY